MNTKKLLATTVCLGAMLATGCNGSSELHGNKLLTPENVYEVDGWGANPDIYEFTPDGHPHMVCLILTSGGDNAGGLECFQRKAGDAK